MHKTLFSKHFMMVSAIILLSITILGAVLLAFSTQYFKEDRYQLLGHNAHQAAILTYADFKNNNYEAVNPRLVMPMYKILADAIEADIYLVNTQGEMLLFVSGSPEQPVDKLISPSIIQKACQGERYEELGTMSGIYKTRHYTVGVPVKTEQGQPAAVVFASASASTLTVFLVEILKMFVISSLAVLILAFVAVYFLTMGLVQPLRKMVAATQSFSRGDYTVRVQVNSGDEIGQLANEFNYMAEALARNEAMNRSFVANVSHELKTPMTTIGGFVDGILDGTIPQEKHHQYLAIVSGEVKRLSRMVRSMLDLAKIEAGEMKLNPAEFDLNNTVCQVIFSFEQAIEAKNLDIIGLDVDKIMLSCKAY